jgi:membrane fusion protein, copper/silver efflux system
MNAESDPGAVRRPTASRWWTWLRLPAYATVVAAAVLASWLLTRGDATAPDSGDHDHAAMAGATGDSAQPVVLNAEQSRRIGVTYAVATVGPLGREVRTVGQVTADETRLHAIAPKLDGWVETLYVNATGQAVSKGQPLLTLHSPMLVQAQEELLLAATLQRDMRSASAEARASAESLVEAARRRLAYWDISEGEVAEIERSGRVRRTLTLHAGASGHVLEKNVVAGQRIAAGELLYRLADLREVWVEGEVFEQDLGGVRTGQVVHADFPALPDEHRMGRVAYVYPTVSPDTRTARVRVVLANADLRLKPGMYATLRIVGDERERALTVPRDAVLSTGERSVVFVREASGQLVPREVAVGASTPDRIEILRGLAEGETVVASATFLIDAESNLGKALGGMGDMPGMEMSTPPRALPMKETGRAARSTPSRGMSRPSPDTARDPHAGHARP